MQEESYFETIKIRIINSALCVEDTAKEKDINRNHVNYGYCICLARVLRDMGHEVDVPVYEEDGALRIPFISIDGQKVIDIGKAMAAVVVDADPEGPGIEVSEDTVKKFRKNILYCIGKNGETGDIEISPMNEENCIKLHGAEWVKSFIKELETFIEE